MWVQSVVVGVVVVGCGVYVVRAMVRKVSRTQEGGCGACGGCAQPSAKGCAQPVLIHPRKP